jgi:hypothetical protein
VTNDLRNRVGVRRASLAENTASDRVIRVYRERMMSVPSASWTAVSARGDGADVEPTALGSLSSHERPR